MRRVRVEAVGRIQGVGFRPLVSNLARELGLTGWVRNGPAGASIEVQGPEAAVDLFAARARDAAGARGELDRWEVGGAGVRVEEGFEIRESEAGRSTAPMPLDRVTCAECRGELFDPESRRWRYPFTTCTRCGPRYTILRRLPYDRANTTMASFTPCEACAAEARDPRNRRFHHQANACPACGPTLMLRDLQGHVLAKGDAAVTGAVGAIRRGGIVAVKGVGGYQLLADARAEEPIELLRRRKRREAKPFAIMAPHLGWARAHCAMSSGEEEALTGPRGPIVLLRRRDAASDAVPATVAPDNPHLGVMLPTSPLHHLLLADLGTAVVATSANHSGDPIPHDDADALRYLFDIADLVLTHNRPIARPADDSVVRVMAGAPTILRAARGYAPVRIERGVPLPAVVGFGGHLKSAVAGAIGTAVDLGPHIGDLESPRGIDAHRRAVEALARDYPLEGAVRSADLHDEYASTLLAEADGARVLRVQHHYAHALAAAADAGVRPPFLAIVWDGSGLGPHGTLWGGEFVRVGTRDWHRVAHLRPFRLPGGDAAAREGRRAALGVLHEIFGDKVVERDDLAPVRAFDPGERAVLARMLARGIEAPWTSSAGRLFDAAAALVDLRQRSAFEGEAAMALEFAADGGGDEGAYPTEIRENVAGAATVDWRPLVEALLFDRAGGASVEAIASRFHAGLVDAILTIARLVGERRVVLSGGCFQNKILLEGAVTALRADGFDVGIHRRVPPNDGALALGQVLAAIRELGVR
ncbi:MAG: carbamoyltransferase HypF [Myxococcales bacterium]|nr:carbamoyltransferase HypF [Myxococcales bacterium]